MEKWEPLNMENRSWVISQMLRLEQTSSELIRTILRMFNKESKTLGNKSSALSFKTKIDLLYDLEEISKLEYTHLLKLMEVRNQFAHNHNAVSFESLDGINSDINKYLLKYEPEGLAEGITREEKLKFIFSDLFKQIAGKLLVSQIEYKEGMQDELRQYINDKVVENIEDVWKSALERNKQSKIDNPAVFMMQSSEKEIEDFYYDFRVSLAEYSLKEVEIAEKGKITKVFKKKTPSEAILKRIEKQEKTTPNNVQK